MSAILGLEFVLELIRIKRVSLNSIKKNSHEIDFFIKCYKIEKF